jgi:hypothetical protein
MSELLQQVEELAELYFTPDEIHLVTGYPVSDLKDVSTLAGKAFAKGRLLGKALLRKTIVDMAKNGSTDALKQLENIYLQSEAESLRRNHG